MGFADQLARIMEDVPKTRQTLLFSATVPPSLEKLANRILHNPKHISIGKPLSAATSVEQRVLWMKEESKNRELMKMIREEPGTMIVFTRSKDGASRVWRTLHSRGIYEATVIHSDKLQSHREQALVDFKDGTYRILIATDVAARGIHVDNVAHVINYDFPMEAEDYVHRIGRTGRKDATGKATTFATQRDRPMLERIQKLIKKEIPAHFADQMGPPRPSGEVSPVKMNAPISNENGAPHIGVTASPEGAPAKRKRRRGGRGKGKPSSNAIKETPTS